MMISPSEMERERYESHLKMQRDIYTAMAEKLDEGRKQGLKRGLAKSRRDDIRRLQEISGRDVMSLDELRTLPPPELEDLAARLHAELRARLANGS